MRKPSSGESSSVAVPPDIAALRTAPLIENQEKAGRQKGCIRLSEKKRTLDGW